MTEPAAEESPDIAEPAVGADTSRSLAAALERFDAGISLRERQLLRRLLVSSMTPLERVRFLDAGPLLSAQEWAALRGGPAVDADRG